MKTKQVIVMRKDLNMRKGKMIAQGAHASMKAIIDISVTRINDEDEPHIAIPLREEILEWLTDKFTKVCVSVDSEEELLLIYAKASYNKLICSLITDAGLTEFNGEPTVTCCAIGPGPVDEIDKITGHLKLL